MKMIRTRYGLPGLRLKLTLALSVFCMFVLAAGIARAEPQVPAALQPPPDPQIGALPGNVFFTKSFTYKAEPDKPDATEEEKELRRFRAQFPVTERIEVTRTGDIRREIETFTNGTSIEKWKSGQLTFETNTLNPKQITVTAPGMNVGAVDPATELDFAELAWVNKAAFKGEEMHEGVRCCVYKSGDQVAWINQGTRMPLRLQSAKLQVVYVFKPGPAQALQLPERFRKKLESVKRAWRGGPSTY